MADTPRDALGTQNAHYGKWNLRIDSATATQVFEREWFYSQADTAVHTRASSSPELKGMTRVAPVLPERRV